MPPLRKRMRFKQPDPLLKAPSRGIDDFIGNDPGSGGLSEPDQSSGVSPEQLALTLLMSTYAAAQAEAQAQAPKEEEVTEGSESGLNFSLPSMHSVPSPVVAGSAPLKATLSPRSSNASSSSSDSSSSDSDEVDPPPDGREELAQKKLREELASNMFSPVSVATPQAAPMMTPGMHAQCCATIQDAILGRLPNWPQDGQGVCAPPSRREVAEVAKEIAAEFTAQWGQVKSPRLQLRTFLWNLRDVQNPDFVRLVASREIAPQQVPTIASEAMASTSKQSERAVLRERQERESTLKIGLSGMMDPGALQAYKALVSRK